MTRGIPFARQVYKVCGKIRSDFSCWSAVCLFVVFSNTVKLSVSRVRLQLPTARKNVARYDDGRGDFHSEPKDTF